MDQDILTSQWRHMQGALRSWWDKLTDDDFEQIGGQKDKLISWVQAHYGQTRDQAQQEVERHMKEYSARKAPPVSHARPEAPQTAAELTARARQLGAAAIMTTNPVATGTTVGEGSESPYGQDKGSQDLITDLIALVRSYPVPLFFVGTGLGYLLARRTKG